MEGDIGRRRPLGRGWGSAVGIFGLSRGVSVSALQRSAAPRRAALLSPCPQLPLLTALFSPPPPNPLPFSSLEAKHVNKKATKKHQDRRPKKSRPSDINRKPVEYPDAGTAPPEYTISDAPAVVAKKPE